MTMRVAAGMRAVRLVAERVDPTEEIGTGAIAAGLGIALSSASRLCTELESVGLLERGDGYGRYRLGRRAIRLSGRAASPVSLSARYALTTAAQVTGETACLAARTGGEARIIGAVGSEWTLHASAEVGERIDAGSAAARAVGDPDPGQSERWRDRLYESTVGRVVEIAAPVLDPTGECVAAVAVRLPVNRSNRGIPRARRAVEAARRDVEAALAARAAATTPPDVAPGRPTGAIDAAARILDHLAGGADTAVGIARATGLRPDRTQRLLESCAAAGVLRSDPVTGLHDLRWGVHAWYRATTAAALVARGRPLVAAAAAATGTFGFITVLKGIRSFTVVEELGAADGGIVMMPWLGRPHPIVGSDGGPSLIAGVSPDFLLPLLRKRHSERELTTLLEQTRTVARDGVLSIESMEEAGLISTSAPIYDASGAVAGAACLTGSTDKVKARVHEVKRTTKELATAVSAALT